MEKSDDLDTAHDNSHEETLSLKVIIPCPSHLLNLSFNTNI